MLPTPQRTDSIPPLVIYLQAMANGQRRREGLAIMAPSTKLRVIEQCQISPAPSSAARPSSLPLTFFDLVFFPFPPVQRLFFYNFPHPKSHFLDSELPNLKHSLALALHYFYPLAGRLILFSNVKKPEIRCLDGDFVSLIVAVSSDDFHALSENSSRDVGRFHPLVPPLPAEDAVLAVQVTVFPNAGVGIGTTLLHAVGDGSTYTHFMKTWASICRGSGADVVGSLPFYDRSVIGDPNGLGSVFLKDLESFKDDRRLKVWDLDGRDNVVRATFVFGRELIGRLGRWVARKTSSRCSPVSLACGYVWACLVRARGDTGGEMEHFGFVNGCRARMKPPIPANYFGNCLGICCVEVKRSEIVGDDGAAVAAAAIWRVVEGLEEGLLDGAANWVRDVYNYASLGALTVAGSRKLGVYGVDFGWGRPHKVEIISIERTGALSVAESRAEEGGIEVGLALPSFEMLEFVSVFEDGLSNVM